MVTPQANILHFVDFQYVSKRQKYIAMEIGLHGSVIRIAWA